jgi:hypothetical protein
MGQLGDDRMKRHGARYAEEFAFDEGLFRQYYLLHLRPHERRTGGNLTTRGIGLLLFGGFIGLLLFSSGSAAEVVGLASSDARARDGLVLFLVFSLLGALDLALGIWHLRGRRPRWDDPSWRWRVDESFGAIRRGDPQPGWNLLDGCLPTGRSPYSSEVESRSPLFIGALSWGAGSGSWHDCDLWLPGRAGRFDPADPAPNAPHEAAFSVRLGDAGPERGSGSEGPWGWEEVHDLLEGRRFPDVAVLRSKNRGEMVLLKDGFGAPWPEVRRYVEGMMDAHRPQGRLAGMLKRRGRE